MLHALLYSPSVSDAMHKQRLREGAGPKLSCRALPTLHSHSPLLKLNIIQLKFDEYKLQKSGERRTLHVLLSRYRNYFRSKDSGMSTVEVEYNPVEVGLI